MKLLLRIASWRAPGSILKAPRLALGGSGGDFSKLSLVFLACCLENVPPVLSLQIVPRSRRVTARLPRIARLPYPRGVGPRLLLHVLEHVGSKTSLQYSLQRSLPCWSSRNVKRKLSICQDRAESQHVCLESLGCISLSSIKY